MKKFPMKLSLYAIKNFIIESYPLIFYNGFLIFLGEKLLVVQMLLLHKITKRK